MARAAAAVGVARAALPRGWPRQLLRKQGEALAVQAEGPESKKPAAAVAPSKGADNMYTVRAAVLTVSERGQKVVFTSYNND